jgi:hypothetical protein
MAIVIKGYLDDSRDKLVWAIAGFVGFVDQWEDFEDPWRLLLETHDLPYLHMREIVSPTGVYPKWQPPQEQDSGARQVSG